MLVDEIVEFVEANTKMECLPVKKNIDRSRLVIPITDGKKKEDKLNMAMVVIGGIIDMETDDEMKRLILLRIANAEATLRNKAREANV